MYHDVLVNIKNALRADKKTLRTPFSKMDFEIAKLLVKTSFIKNARKRTVGKLDFLELDLASDRRMVDFKLVSKPSRRMYRGYRALKSVRQGHGFGVVSTPKGIMTNKDAQAQKQGGVYLFEIW